ncbi:hypothetical protein [Taklimakanibacter albus]|uniref:Uncharacterized protein n=1 Tax=Taklimakanibacter albus TaxID=2800327 RepID=A0ACC5RFV9_9HYPH|nr:hypothetical protein [Aestuariivirga sp. YIM B02566]MBK1871537.1 hypothetical protein [Aestuariivirga sp. YIM B02566]
MARSLDDKKWFLEHPALWGRNAWLDFGCADGVLTREIAASTPLGHPVVGYDNDHVQILNARQDGRGVIKYASDWHKAQADWLSIEGPRVVVFSSVLHEVVASADYGAPHNQAIRNAEYVVIRDMYWGQTNKEIEDDERRGYTVDVKFPLAWKRMVAHEERFGFIRKSQKSFVHLLLKEQHRDNWESEWREDYFALTPERLHALLGERFIPVYFETYTLPYFKQWAKQTFNINVIDHTHLKAIFKRVR